jgi:hypothetical protein
MACWLLAAALAKVVPDVPWPWWALRATNQNQKCYTSREREGVINFAIASSVFCFCFFRASLNNPIKFRGANGGANFAPLKGGLQIRYPKTSYPFAHFFLGFKRTTIGMGGGVRWREDLEMGMGLAMMGVGLTAAEGGLAVKGHGDAT